MIDRLYDQLAHLWPLLSPAEDYISEADRIRELIGTHYSGETEPPLHVVELGAGGGHTLFHLVNDFRCTAIDLSDAMLANSRHINPDVSHLVADMRDFQLDSPCDVVLLHDAAEYLTHPADIAATFQAASRGLKAGGLLILATSYLHETFVDGDAMEDVNADDDTEIRYITSVAAIPGKHHLMELNLTLFIRDLRSESMTIETDRHVCGLFAKNDWVEWLQAAGFEIVKSANLEAGNDDGDAAGEIEGIPTFVARKR